MRKELAIDRCRLGSHMADTKRAILRADVAHAPCKKCGCSLMRTQATRRWFMVGMLG